MTHAGAVSSPAGSAFSTAIDAALDGTPLRAYQLRVAMLCAIVAMLDGFDTQAIAFVAPVLGELWHVGPGRFGLIFAAGLVGIMVGQLTLGRLADSIGRRPVILFCTALFAAGSLVTAKADGWIMLLMLRFVTGIGLGGATPNVIALTAEFSPPRIRATMITAMFAGFPLGAAAGGYLSSHLIPAYGWQSVFILGGLVPLALLAFLVPALPESPHHLGLRGGGDPRLARILARLFPTGVPEALQNWTAAAVDRAQTAHAPAASVTPAPRERLFGPHRTAMTLLLWVAYFNSLLMIYFLMSWLPAVVRQSGMPLDTAIISSVFLNLGGAIGGVLLGRLSDRYGAFRVLAAGYAAAGIALISIGAASGSTALLMLLVFVAGLCTIGGQTAMNAAATSLYPASIRATALGTALAVGRVGSIVGPTVGGLLLASGWPIPAVFTAVAAPALITCVTSILLIGRGPRP